MHDSHWHRNLDSKLCVVLIRQKLVGARIVGRLDGASVGDVLDFLLHRLCEVGDEAIRGHRTLRHIHIGPKQTAEQSEHT